MSGTAIVMMIVAMVTVWGGLGLALINIKRSPEEVDELDSPAPGEREPVRDGDTVRGGETVQAGESAASSGRPA